MPFQCVRLIVRARVCVYVYDAHCTRMCVLGLYGDFECVHIYHCVNSFWFRVVVLLFFRVRSYGCIYDEYYSGCERTRKPMHSHTCERSGVAWMIVQERMNRSHGKKRTNIWKRTAFTIRSHIGSRRSYHIRKRLARSSKMSQTILIFKCLFIYPAFR